MFIFRTMWNYKIPHYSNRKSRNNYLLELVKSFNSNTETILNLGGGKERYLDNSGYKVTEVDIDGDNDLILNLDEIDKIPLNNNSYDMVIALDVLEHLENFHFILDEMLRITKKHIVISLPNSVLTFFNIFFNKVNENNPLENGIYTKYYGLPIKKPYDRHRWFLTIKDMEVFFNSYANEHNLNINTISPKMSSMKSKLISLFLSKRLNKELFSSNFWVVLEKP